MAILVLERISEGKKVLQFSFSFEYAEELLAPAIMAQFPY